MRNTDFPPVPVSEWDPWRLDPWATNFGGGYLYQIDIGYRYSSAFDIGVFDVQGFDAGPSQESMRTYLSLSPEFYELSAPIQAAVLASPKLLAATYDFLASNHSFEEYGGMGQFDGSTIKLSVGMSSGSDSNQMDIVNFAHEIGHYITGVPNPAAFTNKLDYAQTRAVAEYESSIFATDVAKDLSIDPNLVGYLTSKVVRELQAGEISNESRQENISAILNSDVKNANGFQVADVNYDGRTTNLDLYLIQWASTTGGPL